MAIKMKAVSNFAAGAGALVVLVSYIFKLANVADIDMETALKTGGFLKLVFLGVDASVLAGNVFHARRGGGRDE